MAQAVDDASQFIARALVPALVWGLVCVFLFGRQTTHAQDTNVVVLLEARILDWVGPPFPQQLTLREGAGRAVTYTVQEIPGLPWLKADLDAYFRKLRGFGGIWVSGCVLLLVFNRRGRRSPKGPGEVRGQPVASIGDLIGQIEVHNAECRKAQSSPDYPAARLVNVPYPFGAEARHTLIMGAPGSGKAAALHQLLTSIRACGDRAVIYDPDLDFIAHHYDPDTDIILNCFDDRSAVWSPFADARGLGDWTKLAETLLPIPSTSDADWTKLARQLFSWTGVVLARREGGCSLPQLLDCLLGPVEQLQVLLCDTPVAAHLADGALGPMSALRQVVIEGIIPLLQLTGRQGAFSLRQWVNHPQSRPGFLFLSAPPSRLAATRPLLGYWADLVVRAILDRRVEGAPCHSTWLVFGEFSSLGRVASLADSPGLFGRLGGRLVVGLQQISQLDDLYGRAKARALIGQCATRLFLGVTDYDTAQFASQSLGRRVEPVHQAQSMRASGPGPDEELKAIWLAEDIMNWPPMQGAIAVPNPRFDAPFPVAPLRFDGLVLPKRAEGWVPRSGGDPVAAFLSRQQPAKIARASEAAAAQGRGPAAPIIGKPTPVDPPAHVRLNPSARPAPDPSDDGDNKPAAEAAKPAAPRRYGFANMLSVDRKEDN